MKKTILTAALLSILPFSVSAQTEPTAKQIEARELAKQFLGQLKPALGAAMKSGGPVHAVDICQDKAPAIAKQLSATSGWKVNRVSLQPRGATAKADAWETQTLAWFDKEQAAGKDVKTLEKFEIVKVAGQETYRYMKAIPTGEMCLTCHGTNIAAPVSQKILALYPADQATGYHKGQIRGAFSFQQTKN